MYIEIDGVKREIDWTELNQLKKDILWIFDENVGELHIAFVPDYSFTLLYWEYLTIDGDDFFYAEQKNFYKEGALIIILCMLAEYVDIPGGNQLVFGNTTLEHILACTTQFNPANEGQNHLKEIIILGLSVAASITKEDLWRNEDLEHADLHEFHSKLKWVDKTFVQAYYKSKLI